MASVLTSHFQSAAQEAFKKVPELLADVRQHFAKDAPIRLMFQAEARFDRINDVAAAGHRSRFDRCAKRGGSASPVGQNRDALDGVGYHASQSRKPPANVYLLPLPPYAPELNPVEHVWDELREKYFHNLAFDSMEALEEQIGTSLRKLQLDHSRIQSIVRWP